MGNGKPVVLNMLATKDRSAYYASATWVIKLESQIMLYRVRTIMHRHGYACEIAVMGNGPLDFTLVVTVGDWHHAYRWLARQS